MNLFKRISNDLINGHSSRDAVTLKRRRGVYYKKKNESNADKVHVPDLELSDKDFIERMKKRSDRWGVYRVKNAMQRHSGYWDVYKDGILIRTEKFKNRKEKIEKLEVIVKSVRNLNDIYIESLHL